MKNQGNLKSGLPSQIFLAMAFFLAILSAFSCSNPVAVSLSFSIFLPSKKYCTDQRNHPVNSYDWWLISILFSNQKSPSWRNQSNNMTKSNGGDIFSWINQQKLNGKPITVVWLLWILNFKEFFGMEGSWIEWKVLSKERST